MLWLVLEWYGATSEVPWLFLLAAWILALVVAAAAYAWWNRAGLWLQLAVRGNVPASGSPAEDLPESVLRSAPQMAPVFEGDALELEVALHTRGSSRGPAWVEGQLNGRRVEFGAGLVPKKGWRRMKIVSELRRGPVGATGWRVSTSDPLGFFTGRRPYADSEVALVFPRFTSLAMRREPHELQASLAAPRAGSGNELFGIREYRPGDSLRRIHWRSSARHGELVVREYEPPGVQTLAIFVDPAPSSLEIADQIARIAASEAWDCIREGGRVVISASGGEPSASPRDLWSQLEWLARYPANCSPPSGELAAKPPEGLLVLITAAPNADLVEVADRVWVVGDAAIDTDVPFERVGLQWPL